MKTSFCGILSALLTSYSRLLSLFLESDLLSFTGSLTISRPVEHVLWSLSNKDGDGFENVT